MANFEVNPITGSLDLVGASASYINGTVATPADLPVTLGTPALDDVYLAKAASGTWLINRKPAGLYVRVTNNGNLSDWVHLGAFPEVNSAANWALFDGSDTTKQLKFDLSGITTGTTRTLTVPDANGTIALTAQLTDTQIFTANGTWTKPAGAKAIYVELVGGGGGGGGGRRGASSTARGGGGGGAGSGRTVMWLSPDQLGATETVTVGAGGTAGTAAANDTDGGAGGAGGTTTFGPLNAYGGNGGNGGNASAVATGGAAATVRGFVFTVTHNTFAGGNGGYEATAPVQGSDSTISPAGGGGGARITAANGTSGAGGAGGSIVSGSGGFNPQSATGGAATTTSVPQGTSGQRLGFIGTGGSGGRFVNATFEPYSGGDGIFGGGGGGGSAGLNDAGGTTAGGKGGDGIAVITTYF